MRRKIRECGAAAAAAVVVVNHRRLWEEDAVLGLTHGVEIMEYGGQIRFASLPARQGFRGRGGLEPVEQRW